jgi:hypothetical protein
MGARGGDGRRRLAWGLGGRSKLGTRGQRKLGAGRSKVSAGVTGVAVVYGERSGGEAARATPAADGGGSAARMEVAGSGRVG